MEPLVIAHRGACGYLPEHTREAKVLAYGQGADYLEQDVVATRDGALVVLHDIYLDDVTNVAERFPGRCRADGRHYVVDFDLDELRQLTLNERRRPGKQERLRAGRFADDRLAFALVTLGEEIRLVKELNRTTGRTVGIYPEIKQPEWHRQHGVDLSAMLLETLASHGYAERGDPAFVQCFDAGELERCREELGTRLKLVQLIDAKAGGDLLTGQNARAVARYADVAAPHYSLLVEPAESTPLRTTRASAVLREAGLALHTFTVRREGLPANVNIETLLEHLWVDAGVQGVFCDHPDVAVGARDRTLHRRLSI